MRRLVSGGTISTQLLETFRWDPQAGFVLLGLHLVRLEQSARFFNVRSDRRLVLATLEAAIQNFCSHTNESPAPIVLSRVSFSVNVVPLNRIPFRFLLL